MTAMMMIFLRRLSKRWWRTLGLSCQSSLKLKNNRHQSTRLLENRKKHSYNKWWKVKWINLRLLLTLFLGPVYFQILNKRQAICLNKNLRVRASLLRTLKRIWWECLKIWRSNLKILTTMTTVKSTTRQFKKLKRWCKGCLGVWWVVRAAKAQTQWCRNYSKEWGCKCLQSDLLKINQTILIQHSSLLTHRCHPSSFSAPIHLVSLFKVSSYCTTSSLVSWVC